MISTNEVKDSILLSISIVNYNTTERVISLIESIYSNVKSLTFEILVVDNGSLDNPDRLVSKFKDVYLIKNDTNVYFTKADNQNISRAKGKYILSINSDTLVQSGTIENMIHFLNEHAEVGAVSPKFVFPDGTLQASFEKFPTFKSSITFAIKSLVNTSKKNSGELGKINYDPDITQEGGILYGACIMIRRDVLNKVGLKDEKLVHGWDEYDWCMRIRDAGWKLYYVHTSVVMHCRSESIKHIKSDEKKMAMIEKLSKDGYYYLHIKHFGYSAYFLLKFIWALNRIKFFS